MARKSAKPAKVAGTMIVLTREQRRQGRKEIRRGIESELAGLSAQSQPIIRTDRTAIIVDTGIYEERHTKPGKWMAIRSEGNLEARLQRLENEAKLHAASANFFLAHEAGDCLFVIRRLRQAIAAGDVEDIATWAIGVGCHQERLAVRQVEYLALAAKRSRIGAKKVASARSARLTKRRTEAVTAEMQRQRASGEPLNFGAACQVVADAEDCDVRSIKNSVPNVWTPRPRRQ